MWRGAGTWSHASGRSAAGASHEPDEPDESLEAGDIDNNDVDDHDHPGSYEHDDADHDCNDSESERHAVTAALHRCRDC